MDFELLAQAVFVAYVLMQFTNSLVKPVIEIVNAALEGKPVKALILELWPLYVSVAIAGSLGWFARFNLLPMFDPDVIGRVLTAIGIGLGPSFIYDLTDTPAPNVVVQVPVESLSAATERHITDQVTEDAKP